MADFISIACLFFNQLTLKLKNSRIYMTNDSLEIFSLHNEIRNPEDDNKIFFCNITITTVLLESFVVVAIICIFQNA